jgi:hypothetical protein
MYSPLAKHIVGLHDIYTYKLHPNDPVEVLKFWNEILHNNETDSLLTFYHHNPRKPEEFNGRPLGIGAIIKGWDK